MKISLKIVFFSCAIFILSKVNAQRLVAYYPFDNEIANDISSNKNDGKINGGVTSYNDRFGNPCGALYFNGKNAFIEVPNSKSLESIRDYLSVSVWFYIDKTSYNKVMRDVSILCKADNSDETESSPQYRVQVLQMAKQSVISLNTAFVRNDDDFMNHSIAFDTWNFLCVTYNGSEVRMYLNGELVWSNPFNETFYKNKSALFIAKDPPGGLEYFRGAMDDLKIYNGVLSAQQIREMYNDQSHNVICSDNYSTQVTNNIQTSASPTSSSTIKAGNDAVQYEHDVTFKTCMLTAIMYDDGVEDNDTISLYFNGKIIVDYQMIRLKHIQPIVKLLELKPGMDNTLASKAWNMGSISPNTLKIDFYEGDWTNNYEKIINKKPFISKVVHSKPGLAGAIKLRCK